MAVLEHGGKTIPLGPDTTVGSGAQASHRVQGEDLAARHFVVRMDPAGAAVLAPSGEACVVAVDGVQVPHFSYVGDSVLGNKAHLGAGVICSNLRLDQKPVTVRTSEVVYETGLRKFGAILGGVV